jgi:hypothetical protein
MSIYVTKRERRSQSAKQLESARVGALSQFRSSPHSLSLTLSLTLSLSLSLFLLLLLFVGPIHRHLDRPTSSTRSSSADVRAHYNSTVGKKRLRLPVTVPTTRVTSSLAAGAGGNGPAAPRQNRRLFQKIARARNARAHFSSISIRLIDSAYIEPQLIEPRLIESADLARSTLVLGLERDSMYDDDLVHLVHLVHLVQSASASIMTSSSPIYLQRRPRSRKLFNFPTHLLVCNNGSVCLSLSLSLSLSLYLLLSRLGVR